MDTSIFKAYDVRGVVPTQLNETAAARIAGGVLHVTAGKRVVVGQDVREHSRGLVDAMIEMLLGSGISKDAVNRDGHTPLMLALKRDHSETIPLLR